MKYLIALFTLILAITTSGNADASRLFGTTNLGLIELNPQTGSVLNVLSAPDVVPEQAVWDSLAFDGESLWFIGSDTNTLFQMNPDTGATQNTFSLPDDPFRQGMTFLNGLLYILETSVLDQNISVFNPQTGVIVNTIDFSGSNINAPLIGNNGFGALPDSNHLFFTTAFTDEVLLVNPTTGIIEDQFSHNQIGVLGGAGLDGEIYLATNTGLSEQIYVYNQNGIEQRRLTVTDSIGIQSLAGYDIPINYVPEDFDKNGYVDGLDLGILLGFWNRVASPDQGELNNIAPIDGLDLGIFLGAWNPPPLNTVTEIPEPNSLCLNIFAITVIFRRYQFASPVIKS